MLRRLRSWWHVQKGAPPSSPATLPVLETPARDAVAALDEGAWRRDPRQCGLADMVFSGWCQAATGELFRGFTVGPHDTVLDIGCGDGLAVTFAAQQGARVLFCDLDAEKLASLSKRLDERGLAGHGALLASGERLPVRDGAMTRVIATEVLEHVADPRAVLAEMVRVGRPGARYLISVPDAAAERFQQPFADPSYFAPPNHVRIIAPREFEDLVESSGLAIEERGQYGFFWFVWMSFFWATRDGAAGTTPTMDQIAPPYHPLLESWAETWSRFLELPGAPAMLQAFNERMPRTRVIVARRR